MVGGGLRRLAAATFVATLLIGATGSPTSPEAEAIRRRIDEIRGPTGLRIGDAQVTSVDVLSKFYARRGFAPAWSPAVADQLMRLIDGADSHGLDPEDYHQTALLVLHSRLSAVRPDPEIVAGYDVLLSDALLRIAYHAIYGKVDPETLDTSWNITQDLDPDLDDRDPADTLRRIIDSSELRESVEALAPDDPIYFAYRRALGRYRNIAAAGGWDPVPEGPKLERGSTGPRVVALRRRLSVTRDLTRGDTTSDRFDESVERALKRFQTRHRLDADGVAGPATIEALGVPVEARIDQIRVNLERARWVLHGLKGSFVLVDIAGFEARYVVDDETVWTSRAQVGRPFRMTPVFRGDIRYLEFNPTWTVPPGILAKDVLPAVRKNVDYLAANEMSILDRSGRRIDPATIDWSSASGQGFPYRIVQSPGPRNALGRVKFMFPNRHLVFLHDTPSRALFHQTDRAFSSGCIRIERPFELATLLLEDPERWSREQIDAAVEARDTLRVDLPRPVPVILLYWTIAVDDDGDVHFKKDLYERDAVVLAALEQDFAIRERHEQEQQR